MVDVLQDALLEFVRELRAAGIEVFLAGGYGLYLRQLALLASSERTYLDRAAWPRPRATADIDVFLPAEVVIDGGHMQQVRAVLDGLRYQPALNYLHFMREGPRGPVRIELLTGPIERSDKVRINGFRVRARRFSALHAYLTTEALDLEHAPQTLALDGTSVLVPNSFAFLLMKLHAFRDRMHADADADDEGRQLGRHHALDVYRVIAMLTEPDEGFVRGRIATHRQAAPVQAAAGVIAEHFARPSSLGVLRLREHRLAGDHLDVARFVELIGDLFSEVRAPYRESDVWT